MTWHEEQHPRGPGGEFTHASVGAWARAASDRLGEMYRRTDLLREAMDGNHPDGHEQAQYRLSQLWHIPSTRPPAPGARRGERTDAEQEQLDTLEQAFETYRNMLGLQEVHRGQLYRGAGGTSFNEYGEYLGKNVTADPPRALRLGYTRAMDDPQLRGSVGAEALTRYGDKQPTSLHPQAGGLWLDPARPGSTHRPYYLNDEGQTADLPRVEQSRSERHKGFRQEIRSGEWRGGANDEPMTRRMGWGPEEGRFGYVLRSDVHTPGGTREGALAFTAAMKRIQPRTRQEQAHRKVRRTPRGTAVSGWMSKASGQIAQTRGEGR